jgi:lipopolysaccharide export LptBFGC system permease protein LptF
MLITLPLYILRELGRGLLPALLTYGFIVMPFFLFEMLRHDVDVWTVTRAAPYIFPFIAGYVLPPTILTGTVMAYGRFASDNEYAAALAGGVRPVWLLAPALACGFIAMLMSLYLNDAVLTHSAHRIGDLLIRGQVDQIREHLSRQGVVQMGSHHIYRFPEDAEGRQALDMTVYDEVDGRRYVKRRIVARDHAISVERQTRNDQTYNVVKLALQNAHIEEVSAGGKVRFSNMRAYTVPVSMQADLETRLNPERVQCWGISMLLRKGREFVAASERKVQALRQQLEAATAAADRDALRQTMDEIRAHAAYRLQRCKRELHSRLALSVSCLLFAVVGTALGLVLQHGERSVRFAAGFVSAVGYFLLFVACRTLADFGPAILWAPNVVLLGVAIYLYRRMSWAT